MISVVQRVSEASVQVEGILVGAIKHGLLALVAIEKGDTDTTAHKLAEKLLAYRMFQDTEGKMNLDVGAVGGGILLVSQFTLAADTGKGLRPSFTPAADPETGQRLFDVVVDRIRSDHPKVATGQFGADMKVALINDGPVTFTFRIPPA
jgi:D-tyrosyl-tRNA(Tyr) deacylase